MKISIVFFLPLLIGCGGPRVDPQFAPYVARFEAEARNQGVPVTVRVSINFVENLRDGKVVGLCHYVSGGDNYIEIDRGQWAIYTDTQREVTIFHELGHCVLNRKNHRNDTIPGTVDLNPGQHWSEPLDCSVMVGLGIPIDQLYLEYRSGYLRELFHEGECAPLAAPGKIQGDT